MGRLTDELARHQFVGIDTSVFIFQLEDSPKYGDLADEVLGTLAKGGFYGVTSLLTLMEVTVRPLQLNRADVADEYELLIGSFPNLTVVEFDRATARRAAELRAALRLRPADALQVAACIEQGATAFVTNDRGLRRVQDVSVLILDDFLPTP